MSLNSKDWGKIGGTLIAGYGLASMGDGAGLKAAGALLPAAGQYVLGDKSLDYQKALNAQARTDKQTTIAADEANGLAQTDQILQGIMSARGTNNVALSNYDTQAMQANATHDVPQFETGADGQFVLEDGKKKQIGSTMAYNNSLAGMNPNLYAGV